MRFKHTNLMKQWGKCSKGTAAMQRSRFKKKSLPAQVSSQVNPGHKGTASKTSGKR